MKTAARLLIVDILLSLSLFLGILWYTEGFLAALNALGWIALGWSALLALLLATYAIIGTLAQGMTDEYPRPESFSSKS